MKTVALIGDSIRFGYQPFVKQTLAGVATVWAPEINGGDSRNVLHHLEEWIDTAKPAVVHINCGLHDLKKPFDTGLAAVDLTEYEHNIHHILKLLLSTVPHVIWALTTPVNYTWHHEIKGFDRFEQDVAAYNTVAVKKANALNIAVNDLYTVIQQAGRDALLVPDGVHFTEQGYEILGAEVSNTIMQYL